MSDITFERDGTRFHYCVDGVCLHEGHVLLCRFGASDYWFTPGGRIRLRETSAEALRREMREELDEDVDVGRLLWVVENFFTHDGLTMHELALMYEIRLPTASPLLDVTQERHTLDGGATLTFRWFPLAELERVDLRPNFLRTALQALPETPQHVAQDEREGWPDHP